MVMSKRKRERLELGRNTDQKKHKPFQKDDRVATSHQKHEGPVGNEAEDKDTGAVAVDAEVESKPVKGTNKTKRKNNQEDSDGQKAALQTAPFTSDTPQTMAQPGNVSASPDKLESSLVKLERRKGRKTKTRGHPKNAEVVSNQREGNRQKGRMRSQKEKPFWKVSDAIGGQMLDLDPIFALNEE